MKNAKYPKNLDILLDSIHKSYRDSKSKKSSQEIKFQLRYGQFSRGTVFFGTPCTLIVAPMHTYSDDAKMVNEVTMVNKVAAKIDVLAELTTKHSRQIASQQVQSEKLK